MAFLAYSPAMTARVSISANVALSSTLPMMSVIVSSTRCVCVYRVADRSPRWRFVTVLWALSGS